MVVQHILESSREVFPHVNSGHCVRAREFRVLGALQFPTKWRSVVQLQWLFSSIRQRPLASTSLPDIVADPAYEIVDPQNKASAASAVNTARLPRRLLTIDWLCLF